MNSRPFRTGLLILGAAIASGVLIPDAFGQGFGGRRGGGLRSGRAPQIRRSPIRAQPSLRSPIRPQPSPRSPIRSGNRSVTGLRGGSVTIGGAHGGIRGPGGPGGSVAGRLEGMKIKTPGGRTVTRGGGGVFGLGGDGTPTAGKIRGGSAGGSSATVRSGAGRALVTDGGFSRYSGGVNLRSPGKTPVRSHRTVAVTRGSLRRKAVVVRRNVVVSFPGRSGWFSSSWYRRYPRAWRPRIRVGRVWLFVPYRSWVTWLAWSPLNAPPPQPVYYNYGTTVVYQGDTVVKGTEKIASAEEYYQQAAAIAESGEESVTEEDEWQSFGVFALVHGDEESSTKMMELNANRSGKIRGNYYDALTETVVPITGAVDKESQRVAWRIGDSKTVVYEAGMADLTKQELTILVHFGKDQTQQWQLVRLEDPETDEKSPKE